MIRRTRASGPEGVREVWTNVAETKEEIRQHRENLKLAVESYRSQIKHLEQELNAYKDVRQSLLSKVEHMKRIAGELDEFLLRLAFDAGAISPEQVHGLAVDPWGLLANFRATFGLAPNMTEEEWLAAQEADAPQQR